MSSQVQPKSLEASPSANCTAEILDLSCQLPTTAVLTLVGENIAGYIAGYIGRQLLQHLHCTSCKEALIGEQQSVRLAQIKDRGNLFAPSVDLCLCVKVCEQHRRSVPTVSFNSRNVQLLLEQSLGDAVSRGIFDKLACIQGTDENHRYFLLRKVCEKYFFIRLSHAARCINLATKLPVRQQLSKKILFLGQ